MPFHLQLGLDKWEQGTAITAKLTFRLCSLIELSHTSCLASFYHSHTVSTFITNDSFSRIFGFFFVVDLVFLCYFMTLMMFLLRTSVMGGQTLYPSLLTGNISGKNS